MAKNIKAVRKGDVCRCIKTNQHIIIQDICADWGNNDLKLIVVFHEVGKPLTKRWMPWSELTGKTLLMGKPKWEII